MPINLIACVTNHKDRLLIGNGKDLVFKLKNDLKFFKNITTNSLIKNAFFKENIVIMGRKTYNSIPNQNRPLKDRINFILTNNKDLINVTENNISINSNIINNLQTNTSYYMTFRTFQKLYRLFKPNVFVIGGAEIYNLFFNKGSLTYPEKLYITEVKDFKYNRIDTSNFIYMDHFKSNFSLYGYSEQYKQNNLTYRILYYKCEYRCNSSYEIQYFNLANKILDKGIQRIDRTNTGTISIFGEQLKFDISNSYIVPLLTTKRIAWKSCIKELLWFLRGETDAKILQKQNVTIWNGNSSREFLDNRNLQHYPEGELGPIYGHQIRYSGAKFPNKEGGIDQLAYIEKLLKTDPFSRRIMWNLWNPSDLNDMALTPCHNQFQLYVEEIDGKKYLSGMVIMRSNDYFLGNPFNIFSYYVLIRILALKCDMLPKELIFSIGDLHIYSNHIQQIKEQMNRPIRSSPTLKLCNNIRDKDYSEITIDDFELIGYFPHSSIKAHMAV